MSMGFTGRLVWVVAGLAAWTIPSASHAQAPVTITVDATAAGQPLRPIWPYFGYDEINYTTTPEGRSLLATLVAANADPVRIRNHFLFNTGDGTPSLKWGSTNAYTEDDAGNPIYDWTLTDGILDAITGAGAFPFIEFGFMPKALSRRPMPYQNLAIITLNSGCFYPPVDFGKWAALIRTFAAHANERYPDAPNQWLWELWNEPDSNYWHGTVDEFATLYDHTEAALHAVLPSAPLGGPAVVSPDGDFLPEFLRHCSEGANAVTGARGTRLDRVTFHAKGGVTVEDGRVRMNLGNQLRLHQAGFRAVTAFPTFRQTPIQITEADPDGCAACLPGENSPMVYRHSPAYGAYEVAMMKHSLDLAAAEGVTLDGVLTWAFTFPGTPQFAGYRVLSSNGIALPVLGAFQLLGRLIGTRVPVASTGARGYSDIVANGVRGLPDVDGLAAFEGDTLRILLWHYHDDLVVAPPIPVHMTITVPARMGTHVNVAQLRVDESNGNAFSLWKAQGSPPAPTETQRAALLQAMAPSSLEPDTTRPVSDGKVELAVDLPRFGVWLFTLTPATTAPPPGAEGCACSLGRPQSRQPGLGYFCAAALGGLWAIRRRRSR